MGPAGGWGGGNADGTPAQNPARCAKTFRQPPADFSIYNPAMYHPAA